MSGMDGRTRSRDDFSLQVKRALGARVAWRCSICDASTSGPQLDPGKSINVGVAAHITAAAARGPRFDNSLTPELRQSTINGIWLCQNCAKLVDNDPLRFQEERLRELKARAEERALANIGVGKANQVGSYGDGHQHVFALPNTHRSNPYYVPKPTVQETLQSLLPGDVVVLCGLGGVGKTQHVVQYAHDHRSRYTNILWASAESPARLHESLANLTEFAGLGLSVGIDSPLPTRVRALCEWLATERKWLLILDNVNSTEAAREIERVLPSAHSGHVLISAQFTEWTSAFRTCIVDAWDPGESEVFLSRRLGHHSSTAQELAALGKDLGWLPLALEHAAAYIIETRVTVDDYRQLLAKNRLTLLARQYSGMTDYGASVANTWQVSISKLSALARAILNIAACLAAEPIPRRVLAPLVDPSFLGGGVSHRAPKWLRGASGGAIGVDLALAELARFSLLTLSQDNFRLHPLLQLVVREIGKTQLLHDHRRLWYRPSKWMWRTRFGIVDEKAYVESLWELRSASLLNADDILPASVYDDVGLLEMQRYSAHVDAVVTGLPEAVFRSYPVYCQLKAQLRSYRDRLNSYEIGIEALKNIFNSAGQGSISLQSEIEWICRNLEEFYREAISTRGSHGISFALRAMATEDARRIPWRIHNFLRDLAIAQIKLSEIANARRLFRFYHDYAVATLGNTSAELGRARLSEALSLYQYTPREELIQLLEEAIGSLEMHERIVALDTLEGVWLYSTLATTADQQSRAIAWLKVAILPARQMLEYGCDHACLLTVAFAGLLRALGGPLEEAQASCEATLLLAMKARKLARESLAPLWYERANILQKRGRFLLSARSYARCLVLERRYQRPTVLRQVELLQDTGEMYRCAETYSAATTALLEAASIVGSGWNEDPSYASTLATLVALGLGRVNQTVKAEHVFIDVIGRCGRVFGAESPDIASAHRLFGIFLHEEQRFSEAAKELRLALSLMEAHCPAGDPELRPYVRSLTKLLDNAGAIPRTQ